MIFLFAAAPALAQGEQPADRAQLLARLAAAVLAKAGITLSGDENELRPTLVDGKGNTVFNIDELVINFNVGDVSIEKEYGNAEEVANRLVDLLMQGMEQHSRMRGGRPLMRMLPTPFAEAGGPCADGPMAQNPHWAEQNRKYQEMRNQMREHHGRGGEFWGPAASGEVESQPGPNPAVMELLMQISPDVEPEFVEFIMHVGRLAREHPRFREALEKMVERAEAQLAEAAAEDRE